MELSFEDADQFFRLHRRLMFFINQRLGVIDEKPESPEAYSHLPPPVRFEVHEAFLEHPELVDAFVGENPLGLDESELEIVGSWKHFVTGQFYIFRYLKNYTVFLSAAAPPAAYGVVALFEPFERLVGPYLPVLVNTTLLPFKGRIVYDGLLSSFNVSFGGGVKRSLNQDYNNAKANQGIIPTLPPGGAAAAPASAKPKRSTAAKSKKKGAAARDVIRMPEAAGPERDRIVALTDEFCRERLDDDFAVLCRKLADALARKRPSPLARGKAESWACGIVLAVGFANFMSSDRSLPYYTPSADVSKVFGVSEATGASKSLEIRKLLGIDRFSPEWTLPSMLDQNPLALLAEFGGLSAEVPSLPEEFLDLLSHFGLSIVDLEEEEDD